MKALSRALGFLVSLAGWLMSVPLLVTGITYSVLIFVSPYAVVVGAGIILLALCLNPLAVRSIKPLRNGWARTGVAVAAMGLMAVGWEMAAVQNPETDTKSPLDATSEVWNSYSGTDGGDMATE